MERNHTPYEVSQVECKDCFSCVLDADEEFCEKCGDPLCEECAHVIADEAICNGCFAVLCAEALKRLQRDSQIGDLFQRAA